MRTLGIAAVIGLTAIVAPLDAQTLQPATPAEQFATIASWEGRWQVAETPALTIVFEKTARGSTMVERWETSSGLHSMTVYHLDGDALIATHYCPQGNQPRLLTVPGDAGTIAFRFHDITGFDKGESHAQTLEFATRNDGTIVRKEVYLGPEGAGGPGIYTLSRRATSD